MKKLAVFSLIVLSSLTVLCQPLNLNPKIIEFDSIEYKCFDELQYSEIVFRVVKQMSSDTIHKRYVDLIHQKDALIDHKDFDLIRQEKIINDQNDLIGKQHHVTALYRKETVALKEIVKKEKRGKMYIGFAAVAVVFLSLTIR